VSTRKSDNDDLGDDEEDKSNRWSEEELAPESIVTGPSFLKIFNEIWGLLQSNIGSSVPKGAISLETVLHEGSKETHTFTKESPPNMCQRCCEKLVAIENLMKAVRHQFWEIKMLMDKTNRKDNGGNMEEPVGNNYFVEEDHFQSDDIKVEEENEEFKFKNQTDLPSCNVLISKINTNKIPTKCFTYIFYLIFNY